MLFLNPTENPVLVRLRHGAVDQFWVQPGETVEIDDKYSLPRPAEGGNARPPVVEEVAPQLIPANDEEKARYTAPVASAAPQKPGTYIPTVEELVRLGTAPGIAKMMVQQALASAQEQVKAYEATEILKIKELVKEKKAKNNG